jgi:chemotaxis protein MotB
MSKRHQKHDEHMDESWLIPYADLLTLLLALFIVLFASSTLDAKKFEMMAQSFSNAFNGGTGVLENPSPTETPVPKSSDNPPNSSAPNNEQNPGQGPQNAQQQQQKSAQQQQETEDLKKLKQNIDDYVQKTQMTGLIETQLLPEGLKIIIRDLAFFESGSGTIRPEARSLAVSLSELLAAYPRKVTVSGHTDNVPIHNRNFDSNWELSTKRAVNFLQIILDNSKLDPANFSAAGYGEYQPVAPNDSAENRGKNRRVEVFIHRKDS